MKVCVFGAGAIGGHVAGRLVKGGAEVSVIARGAHLAAMQQAGLRIDAPDTQFTVPVRASDDPASLGPQDIVLVAVKAPALPSVAAAIGPLLGPETAVAFLMNGIPWWYNHFPPGPLEDQGNRDQRIALLDPDGQLEACVGYRRAIGGVVYSACTVSAPGVIHVEHARNRLVLGDPACEAGAPISARLEALAEPLRAGGLTIELTDRIRDVVWSKLLLNLGSGLLGVLTSSAPRDFFTEEACRQATRDVVREAAAVAGALGCRVSGDAEGQIRNASSSGHRTSILQDLDLGRPMEIDALYTVPLQMARAAGVATPVLDLLVGLTRARARAAGLYGG